MLSWRQGRWPPRKSTCFSSDFKGKQTEDPAQASPKAGSAAAVPDCIDDDFQASGVPGCPMTPAVPEPGLIHPQSTEDPERHPENKQLKMLCRNQLSDTAKRPEFVTEKRKRKRFSRVVDVEEIYLLYSMTLMCVAPTGLFGSGAGDINNHPGHPGRRRGGKNNEEHPCSQREDTMMVSSQLTQALCKSWRRPSPCSKHLAHSSGNSLSFQLSRCTSDVTASLESGGTPTHPLGSLLCTLCGLDPTLQFTN